MKQIGATYLLAALAGLQGVLTPAIDLRRTHALHPQWPGHARFHVIWQSATTALLAAMTEVLLFSSSVPEEQRFRWAALLTAVPMAGFLLALAVGRAFGASLRDPGGSQPLRIRVAGQIRAVDLNLVAVLAGAALLALLCWVHG